MPSSEPAVQSGRRRAPKIQRWLDLLAKLLAHRTPVPFEQIARDVPAYLADGSVERGTPSASLKRMFERDKLELRQLGVPIESVGTEAGGDVAYRLQRKDFYLPYLSVVTARGRSTPRRVDAYGYRALGALELEPEELAAVAEGAARARQLGDPALVADAESAMRKLAFDLPIDAVTAGARDVRMAEPRAPALPATLAALGDALIRRKRVTVTYRSMGRNSTGQRALEPYGLFFVNGHWYLAARDCAKDALRNFRIGRIERVTVNAGSPLNADYAIPEGFVLREHARSRQAWELGDSDAMEARVRFAGTSGAARAGAALGEPVPDAPAERRFRVRRSDAFARWLLSFAGEAVPLAPPELVAEFRTLARETLAVYERGGEAS